MISVGVAADGNQRVRNAFRSGGRDAFSGVLLAVLFGNS